MRSGDRFKVVDKTTVRERREGAGEVSSLSNLTLSDAVQRYVLETIGWFRGFSPEVWKELVAIEGKVNELARTGDAEKLKEMMMAYKKHLEEMVKTLRVEGVKAGDLFELYRRLGRLSR